MKRRAKAVSALILVIGIAAPAAAQPTPRPEVNGLKLDDTAVFTSGTTFSGLVNTVQDEPGTEVKLLGTVGGNPFEAKIERGEVKLQGLSFKNQDELRAFVTTLQGSTAVRELKVEALVNGTRTIAKFENGRLRTEARDVNRGPSHDRVGRDQAQRNRDDRSSRGDRPDRVERNDRTDRVERVERADRIERPDRSGRH